jgi:hypothetical protein
MAMDSTDAPQLIEHINRSLTYTPNDTKWIPCSARFVSMGVPPKNTGMIEVYEINQGEVKVTMKVIAFSFI